MAGFKSREYNYIEGIMSPEQIKELDENWSHSLALGIMLDNINIYKEYTDKNLKIIDDRQSKMAEAAKIVEKQISEQGTKIDIQGVKIDQILEIAKENKTHYNLGDKDNIHNRICADVDALKTKTSNIELKLVGIGVGVSFFWDWLKNRIN